MLIDPCTADATHGAVFAGSGGYKTTAVTIPTLACWAGSAVVLDPSGQVGPMTAGMREKMGHKVVMVGPGLDGFNVLDWIDPSDPLAETHVQAVVELCRDRAPLGTVVDPPDDGFNGAAIFDPGPRPPNVGSRNRCFECRPLAISQHLHRLSPPTIKLISRIVIEASHALRTDPSVLSAG